MTEKLSRYEWNAIEELPPNWRDCVSAELKHIAAIWKEQSAKLRSSRALDEFNERLARQWAIETGIIEGLYTIDRGTTQLLIEKGIEANLIVHGAPDKPAEHVVNIVSVQKAALEGLFDFVASRRPLSTSYIKQLHQVMTEFQGTVVGVDQFGNYVETALISGDWKKLPNNPLRPDAFIHEYCPPEHVAAEMDRLIEMHARHESEEVAPEVEAAWLHHRFTQVHPFQDGNGRIARALASLVFLRNGYFPLVVTREHRSEYVDALEKADKGDLRDLVTLFVRIEKKSFLSALSLSETVLRDYVPLHTVISSALDRLQTRRVAQEQEKAKVFDYAERLRTVTERHFDAVTEGLDPSLHSIDPNYRAFVNASTADDDFWFKKQIIEVAKHLHYFADTGTYRSWIRLALREERVADLVISFHSLGFEFSGILVATAFIEYRQRGEDGTMSIDGPHPLCDEPFEFSYFDLPDQLESRFDQWLRRVTIMGLDDWRRQL